MTVSQRIRVKIPTDRRRFGIISIEYRMMPDVLISCHALQESFHLFPLYIVVRSALPRFAGSGSVMCQIRGPQRELFCGPVFVR